MNVNKEIKARQIQKHDTEENWKKSDFVPKPGEVIIYDADNSHKEPRVKVGDGKANVNNLPFITDFLATKIEVQDYIQKAGHLKREIVVALPSNADKNTIYMIKKTTGSNKNDYYEEYMFVEGAWEKIGDTFVDLTSYATKKFVEDEIDKVEKILENKADRSALEEVSESLASKANSEQVAKDIASAVAPLVTKQYVDDKLASKAAQSDLEKLEDTVDNKADKTQVAKDIATAIAPLAEQTTVNDALDLKADKDDVYTKTEIDSKFDELPENGDQVLKDVEYDPQNKKLIFIWDIIDVETGDYKKTEIDMSNIMTVYEAGDGIKLEGNKFSVEKDANSEDYLSISLDGVKVSGINKIKEDLSKISVYATDDEQGAVMLKFIGSNSEGESDK